MLKPKSDLVYSLKNNQQERLAWSAIRTYQCYCCHDTGYVVRVERVLKETHLFTRPMLCKRIGCTAGINVQNDPKVVDTRLTPEECRELHELAKQDWLKSEANWHEQRQQILVKKISEEATKKIQS